VSFEWGLTTSYGSESTPESKTASGKYSADLDGLSPNTTYHFRAKAVGDETAYGADAQFTTSATPPSAATNDATNVATTSATLNGELTSLGTAGSVSVSFEWGLTTSYGSETTPESKTASGKYSADLDGLSPNTTYHFRVKVVGDDTTCGADVQFTTGTTVPSVATNDATNISTNSARLNGELFSLGTASSINVSFEYGTATGPYTQTTADQARTSTGAFSADLTGLTPGTAYYYRAKADGDGDPVYAEEKSFTTLTAPPAVTTGSATQVRSTSVTLNGIIDSLGTAGSVEVSFEWGLTTAYGSETTPGSKTTTGDFNATLTNLSPSITYHFRAKAAGDGVAYGADMMFTTGNAPPPRKSWYLSGDNSGTQRIMYEDNTSNEVGKVTLWGDSTLVWRADQPSDGITYAAGTWTVQLALNHIKSGHRVDVEIGTWDGNIFTPYGTYTFLGQGNDNEYVYNYKAAFSVRSFTVPSGGYVATRIALNDNHVVYVHVGGSDSYVTSPSFSEPTAPAVTTNAATSVEQTTATLNGYLDSLGTAGGVTVYFEWGMTTDYGNPIDVGPGTSGGNFSAILTNHSEHDLPLQSQGGRRRHQLWCRYDPHNTAIAG
jgi:phosphodiesterase/alkaline phosphatase D-like protein